ncbi:MAG: hypothetical protein Q8932_03835 [Bacteroidota bacterium]|nr:hypothetical protein [Bacteroidota bacterium]
MRLRSILLLVILTLYAGMHRLHAQQDISINVQVNRMADGSYPTRIYQFNNTPGLIMVNLINHTNTVQTLYLDGAVTGDNGVKIITARGYQPASLTLKPFETKILNAIEAGSLFDPNSLIYLSGNTSVKASVFGEQGLPEGTYQVCVRAFDASTRKPLSEEDPVGCSNIFTVASLEPPVILSPINEDSIRAVGPQNIVMRWTTPPGAPQSTQYRILLYEVMSNYYTLDNALLSQRQAFFDLTVQGTPLLLYSMQYPRLQEGRSYVMAVIASDPSGSVHFRNQGVSEPVQFTYAPKQSGSGIYALSANDLIVCPTCMNTIADTRAVDVSNIGIGDKLQIDGFTLEVTKLIGNSSGILRGSGKIKVPFLKFIPVEVRFDDEDGIQLNASKQVISGRVYGQRRNDAASMVPAYDPLQPNLTLNPATLQNFSQYLSSYLASNLSPDNALGYSLPVGLDNVGGVTIAITDMTFTPTSAIFNAGAELDIPEASMTVALGGSHICFSNSTMVCGTGRLYLEKDFVLAGTGLALLTKAGADDGTYIELGKDGMDHMRIKGQYSFAATLLEKKGGGTVNARLTVESTKSWSDWIASVQIDPFHITGNADFGFDPGTAWYDHSDKQNPPGIPATYEEGQTPTWRGFIIPQMQIELPPVIRSFANSQIMASAQNFIIDNQGVSGTLGADNILDIGSGSLGAWQYSVDRIEAVFVKNSFTTGNMRGQVVLPITDANDISSRLDYTCLLNNRNGLQFQFAIVPRNDINVPLWLVQLKLDATSSILVTAGGGSGFKAQAILNGDLSFKTDLGKPLGHVDLTLIGFNKLTLNSSAPFISDGQFVAGHSSPPKFLSGFPVSIPEGQSPSFVFKGNSAGLRVPLLIQLTEAQGQPSAAFSFTVTGSLRVDAQGRVSPDPNPSLSVDSIAVDGDLGPVSIHGHVRFFDQDDYPQWGEGVVGSLGATFQPGFSVKATALFGKKDFSYYFVGANLTLPVPGIPIGGEIIPLSLFGFGGGVYHNVKLVNDPNNSSLINGDDPMNMFTLSQGTVGFMGSITLGSSDEQILVGKGILDAELNENMSFKSFSIIMAASMFTQTPGDASTGLITGHGGIEYDFSQQQLNAGIDVDIAVPGGFAQGKGKLALMANFNTGDWFFKIGEAVPEDQRVSMQLSTPLLRQLNFDFKAYLNLGKNLRLPPDLEAIYSSVEGDLVKPASYVDPVSNQAKPYLSTDGMLLGAKASADLDLRFLIFYAKMGGYLGFDLALVRTQRKCDDGNMAGLNGYYAIGKLGAGFTMDFGLYVDVWFFKGTVSLAAADVGVDITAGFPNPLVLQGWAYARYSVLDDLISGQMNFRVSYSSGGGTNCSLPANPFGDLPLISGIYPANGDLAVNIMSNINVAFNFPVNSEFTVNTLDESTGKFSTKTLKVVVSHLEVKAGGGKNYTYAADMDANGNATISGSDEGTKISAIYHNALLYGWKNAFDANRVHQIKLSVLGLMLNEKTKAWDIKASVIDSVLTFTTGECLKRLDQTDTVSVGRLGNVVLAAAARASYPFPNQRYFLPGQYDHGFIQLGRQIDCLSDPPQQSKLSPIHITKYDLFARFISETDRFESPVTQQGLQLVFPIPNLSPATVYKLQIVKRPAYNTTLQDAMSVARLQTPPPNSVTKTIDYIGQDKTLTRNDVVVQNFSAAMVTSTRIDDEEIYHYYFRTSRFNKLQEKMSGSAQGGGVTWALYMPSFQVSMVEGLDVYDASGYAFDGSGTGETDWFIPPTVNLDEKYSDNPWMQKVITPLVTNYNIISPYDPMAVYNNQWSLISPVGGGSAFTRTVIQGEEPFVVSGAEQPLQPNEIPLLLRFGDSFFVTPNLNNGVATPAVNKISPKLKVIK